MKKLNIIDYIIIAIGIIFIACFVYMGLMYETSKKLKIQIPPYNDNCFVVDKNGMLLGGNRYDIIAYSCQYPEEFSRYYKKLPRKDDKPTYKIYE